MQNVVSFEVAKALKDAGFEQPEPEVGQFWYDRMYQRLSIVVTECGKGVFRICPINCAEWSYLFKAETINGEHIFAPTSSYLLGNRACLPDTLANRWLDNTLEQMSFDELLYDGTADDEPEFLKKK